ncbi:hypothetical protein V6N13_032435 [Hibiscus sabdariffa]|uniref:Uncharacterized protein n=1 Tax=Hibiscus sabdariffa TaxID=183260 RepID=A0ABR2C391_9ROSI
MQELILYAALGCLVLFAGLRHLDPKREASKEALKHKKEIAKRLGRPSIHTKSYERPELFSHGRLLGPQKGVLFYGPPETCGRHI